jgi:hypothetical protein
MPPGQSTEVTARARADLGRCPITIDANEEPVTILVRHRPDGMTPAQYDQIAPPLIEQLKTQPGFVLHTAFEDPEGFCVAEIWETKEQYDAWFNNHVKPNVPVAITQQVIKLHNVIKP